MITAAMLLTAGPVIVAATLLAVGPAAAELYRCTSPDGGTTFTDDPSGCPGAAPHTPRRAVQRVPSVPSGGGLASPHPVAPTAARSRPADDAVLESQWRQKKTSSEAELRALEQRAEHIAGYVKHCNRGGELFIRRESGLKADLSCAAVREHHAELEARQAELRQYLARGIHEECRRAGCLPGWLR